MDADVARAPEGYRAVWSSFDNATGETSPLDESMGRTTKIAAPDLPHGDGVFIKVQVSAINAGYPSWHTPVDAYFRRTPAGWTLVGFERMPESPRATVATN